jgi:hypothetical protein
VEIRLGSHNATEVVVLASNVEAELNAIKTALDTLSAGGGADFTGANSCVSVGVVDTERVEAN